MPAAEMKTMAVNEAKDRLDRARRRGYTRW